MNHWTDEFVSRCLKGVPEGDYRTRTAKELQDHLLTLERSLEEAGYAPEEARALAQSRMGDPAELARRYALEWRRRMRPCRLFAYGTLLFGLCVCAAGYLYAINTRNFGKIYVATWGEVASVVVMTMALSTVFASHTTWKWTWTVPRWSSMTFAVIQYPPLFCWLIYFWDAFEFSGVMVPGWAGFSVHLLFFLWALANYELATRLQRGRTPLRTVSN